MGVSKRDRRKERSMKKGCTSQSLSRVGGKEMEGRERDSARSRKGAI